MLGIGISFGIGRGSPPTLGNAVTLNGQIVLLNGFVITVGG